MNSSMTDLVIPKIGSSFGESLRECIPGAEGMARKVIEDGEPARWFHRSGCANNSKRSSVGGAIAMADSLIGASVSADEVDDEHLFGNNLREAYRAFRKFLR